MVPGDPSRMSQAARQPGGGQRAPHPIHHRENLVILLGSVRGSVKAWHSLKDNVLTPNHADLALMIGAPRPGDRPTALHKLAKYVWTVPERDSWGDALDDICERMDRPPADLNLNCSVWPASWFKICRPTSPFWCNTTQWAEFRARYIKGGGGNISLAMYYTHRRQFLDNLNVPLWLGPIKWSATINLVMRYEAKQRLLQLGLLSRYRRFMITRADQYYGCPLHFEQLHPYSTSASAPVLLPEGEDSGGTGVCDRVLICSRQHVLSCLSLIDGFLKRPNLYRGVGSPEAFVKKRLMELGLTVLRFPRTMFTSAAPDDATRFSLMSAEDDSTFGVRFKYAYEYAATKVTCARCDRVGEPYCCASMYYAAPRALEWLLGGRITALGTAGECLPQPQWWLRPTTATAAVLGLSYAVLAALRRRRQAGALLPVRLAQLISLLLPGDAAAARGAQPPTAVRLSHGGCSPTTGFQEHDAPAGLWGHARSALQWRAGTGEWSPIHCTEAVQRSTSAWRTGLQQRAPKAAAEAASPAASPTARVEARVLFAGCARNVARQLPDTAEHIDALGQSFAEHRVLIWEDGSSDGTRLLLRNWTARNSRVRVLFGEPPATRWRTFSRPTRIAFCRNILLVESLRFMGRRPAEAVRTIAAVPRPVPAPQMLVMIDLDCPPLLQPSALAGSVQRMLAGTAVPPPLQPRWQQRGAHGVPPPPAAGPVWHALFGNSVPRYYDLWALRSAALGLDYDCLEDKTQVEAHGFCFVYGIELDPRAPPVPVDSAFNGVAVYSMSALRHAGCSYELSSKLATCEHVGFHMCLRRRGLRLGIDPSLVQGCGAEHAHAAYPRSKHVSAHPNGTISRS